MPGSFVKPLPLLKMVVQSGGYIVYRCQVTWKGTPTVPFRVLGFDPSSSVGLPPGQPFSIENCAKVGFALVVGEVVFTPASVDPFLWHRDVFHPSKTVRLLIEFPAVPPAQPVVTSLDVGCTCWSHEVAAFLAAQAAIAIHETLEAAKAVGSALISTLAYPLRMLFGRKQ